MNKRNSNEKPEEYFRAKKLITEGKYDEVCLVCKGEVLGYIYICDCDAIYCENCARALTDLENACWVCGAPIDISKPIKPYIKDQIREKSKIIKNHKKRK